MDKFGDMFRLPILETIIVLILGAIGAALCPASAGDIFTAIFVIVVAIGSLILPGEKVAAVNGAIIGFLVGLFQNHVIGYAIGQSMPVVNAMFGEPFWFDLVIGIIVAVVINYLYKYYKDMN